jgi:hypothetical protein
VEIEKEGQCGPVAMMARGSSMVECIDEGI